MRHPTVEIDVRPMPVSERHPRIMAAFDALEVGAELRIISDHEPRPLRGEFERTRSGRYVWLQRALSSDRWEVTLRRVPQPPTNGVRDFLQRCALFADASVSTLSAIEAAVTRRNFAHKETVVEQEAEWNAFGIVEEGTLAAIITSPLGREHTLFEILAGEALGEIALLGGGAVIARFVVTSNSATVLFIPKPVMRAAIESDRTLALAVATLCAQRSRTLIERFAAQTSLSTAARVAAALLPHAAPAAGLSPVLPSFHNMTQVELATAAGTVKEVVSRALAELEREGALRRRGGRIVELDREKLTRSSRV